MEDLASYLPSTTITPLGSLSGAFTRPLKRSPVGYSDVWKNCIDSTPPSIDVFLGEDHDRWTSPVELPQIVMVKEFPIQNESLFFLRRLTSFSPFKEPAALPPPLCSLAVFNIKGDANRPYRELRMLEIHDWILSNFPWKAQGIASGILEGLISESSVICAVMQRLSRRFPSKASLLCWIIAGDLVAKNPITFLHVRTIRNLLGSALREPNSGSIFISKWRLGHCMKTCAVLYAIESP